MSYLTTNSLVVSLMLLQLIPHLSGFPAPFQQLKEMQILPEYFQSVSVEKAKLHSSSMFEYWTPPNKESKSSAPEWWIYNDPSAWSSTYPTCGEDSQSPIDIHPHSSIPERYPKFTFHNYGNIGNVQLTNNGHTAVYSLPDNYPSSDVPYITGGGLVGQFNFVQFHLHWGSDSSKGSEHRISSQSYPAELHMVHYNTKYPSFPEATNYPDGLAVLGIFIQVSRDDNEALQPLVQQLSEIHESTHEITLTQPVPFHELLPEQTPSFFRYRGSLTTPTCNQIVTWTVFLHPIYLSENQLSLFRTLEAVRGSELVNNFRPTQPLNSRVVTYKSFNECDEIYGSYHGFSYPSMWNTFWWEQCLANYINYIDDSLSSSLYNLESFLFGK